MRRRTLWLVPLLCAPLFLVGLGRTGLSDPDEGRNAEVAREMLASGDWITPRINDTVYLDKPPVFFWAVAASMGVLGVDETAARLPSALSALAALALTVWFARRRFGERAAWLVGPILALSPLYVVFARLVIFDMMLLLTTTASVLAAYEAMEAERPGGAAPWIFFGAAAIGTITKGPVALAVPVLVAVAWGLASGRPRRLGRLRWGRGLLLYLAIIIPWLALIEARQPGFLRYAILGENLERMTADPFETARPVYFYFKVLLPGLFPWIFLVVAEGAVVAVRRLRGRRVPAPGDARAARFAAVWLLTLVGFFSLVASKRPSYILPCAVPVALLAARLVARAASAGEDEAGARARSSGAVAAAIACLTLAAGAFLAGPVLRSTALADARRAPFLAHRTLFFATGAALLAVAAILVATRRTRRPWLYLAAAGLPFFAMLPMARAAARQIEVARSSRGVSHFLASRLAPDDRVICFEEYRPGLNFYLQRPIWQITRAGRIFTSNYIVTRAASLKGRPDFRFLDPDGFRAAFRDPGRATWVLVPHKEYGPLRAMVGDPALEPVREAGGFGLFAGEGG